MMKIELLVMGKLKESYDRQALALYEKRIQAFCQFTVTEIKEVPLKDDSPASIQLALKEEAKLIKAKIAPRAFVIVLDRLGQSWTSEQFALQIESIKQQHAHIIFIIGSAWGLDESIKKEANRLWSFSPLTFPHPMMRVMLGEQIYRAMMILENQPYHK
jgi:23S rRNA (pseudouridine1915-N3)-methyltransferase